MNLSFRRRAGDTMLELISIVAGLIVCIAMPIEVGKVRKGWVRKSFKGGRPEFLVAYRKQIKLVGAAVWFVVSAISFFSLRELAKVPDAL